LAAAGFRLALHGHIHKAEVTQFRYDRTPGGRRLDILAAGTFGAPSHQWVPGYPLQYQLLRLGSGGVTVETRRREEPNGTWKPDARWLQGPGQDPVPRYFVELRGAG
jgi:3',5'-cyclic AMP phosphodiesterase CpdA